MEYGFSTRYADTTSADFRHFAILKPIRYMSKAGILYEIPHGMQTDLASIPRALWELLPPTGEDGAEYGTAAVLHDAIYRRKLLLVNSDGTTSKAIFGRLEADDLLLEAMLYCRVPEAIAQAIYQGVRLGGQSAWDANG